ncbi:hypothetical protein [Haloferax marisrubri]|nr:hypothetical protein [Haloferax marisrubri]
MPTTVLPAGVSRWRLAVFAVRSTLGVVVEADNHRHETSYLRLDFE